ncbi:MAG TPA: hypothetical protein DD727_08025 [Clostridiales bacterium]|nr:hypothetical protein [Clostridiales bacterium]
MTKREIVKAAIRHEETGVIPFHINLAGDAIQKYLDTLYKQYAMPGFRKLVDKGILNKTEALHLSMGSQLFTLGCPWWNWYDVPPSYSRDFDAPDFLPKTVGRGSYEQLVEKVKIISDLTGSYQLVMIYGSHFEKANFARGIENFLADLAGEKEYARRLLNFIIHKNMVMLENIVAIPEIDGILLGSDWGSQQALLMDPATWHELIEPGEKAEYDLLKSEGKDVWIHSCGNIETILPDLVRMGVDVLNPLQPECMDIYKIKAKYGKDLTFWGGISTQQTLPYGTPAQVRDEAAKVIQSLSKGGGYITAPAQGIQADVPLENILALIDTAREFAGIGRS